MTIRDSEPIHGWFGLSYVDHLVLDPIRTNALPPTWHLEMAAMLDQLRRSFPDINPNGDEALALAGGESEYGELDPHQMQMLGVTSNERDRHEGCDHQDETEEAECDVEPYWYDWRGDEHSYYERVVVPSETVPQARAAGRTVVSRTLLQSMPADWQARFVTLVDQMDDVNVESPEDYDIRFYTPDGIRTTDPVPHYNRGRTRLVPSVVA